MTFLNPAVLLGLLAASIPILIHLLNLRKLKRVEFSSLMFLKELQKNQIRKIKLKQWLLLLIRVMIVILLVTAFARPTLETAVIGGTSSTVKTSAVFIIDDSFSMDVLETNGSRFNIAKNITKQLLAQLNEGDDATLIFLSQKSDAEKILSKNIKELSAQIDEKEISFVSGDVHNAFTLAALALDKSQNYSKEIYFVSDFQTANYNKENIYSDFSEVLNERVKLFLFRFDEKDVNNLSLDSLRMNTQLFEKNKPVNVSVFISNHSKQKIENRVISLFINGERSAQKGFTIDAGASQELILEGTIKSSGYNKIVVETEDDELNVDNKRYISFFMPEKINVILATEKNGDEKFITTVLHAVGREMINFNVKNISQINLSELKKYEVLYLIGTKEEIKPAVKSFVESGGGVFFFPSSVGEISSLNSFMNSLALPNFKQKKIVDDKSNDEYYFGETDFNHPIFQNLFEQKKKKEIDAPFFNSYFQFFTDGRGSRIITMPDRSSFFSEFKIGDGKFLIVNVSPTLEHSNFPLKSVFVSMIVKSLFYLSSNESMKSSIIAGDELQIDLSKFPQRKARIVSSTQGNEFVNLEDHHNNKYLSFSKTSHPGFYELFADNDLVDLKSVNVDAKESQQRYLSEEDFEKYLKEINYKGAINWIDISLNFTDEITRARFGSELWKIFLIAALLFALLEMFIARTKKNEK